jgi:hypothetical protein
MMIASPSVTPPPARLPTKRLFGSSGLVVVLGMKRFPAPAIMMLWLMTGCGGDGPQPPTSPRPLVVATPAPPPPAPPAPPPPGSGQSLVGEYTLELALGEQCGLPDLVRRQQFSASIQSAANGYVVTLGDAVFLTGTICTAAPSLLGCNQFLASDDGQTVRFELRNENDDGHGGHPVVRLSDGTWVELVGHASGPVDGSTILAQGSVQAWYCPTSLSYPFPCRTFTSCESDGFTLAFKKRE